GFAAIVAALARRTPAGPARHSRPVASRRILSTLAPSVATSWETADRCRVSRLKPANGRREPSLGAPRIHGELLKLGIAVSERTVSRYLRRDRLTAPSQTWRTFFVNHIGQLTLISPAIAACAPDVDNIGDASGRLPGQSP